MIHVTFDTNIVIDIGKNEQDHEDLLLIGKYHKKRAIKICVPAIMASENKAQNSPINNYNDFKKHLISLELEGAEILEPPFICGITYYGVSTLASDATVIQLNNISETLFNIKLFDTNNAPLNPHKHRNKLCDVLALHAHILYKKDIFITGDKNFHKMTKKNKLIALGSKEILRPAEFVNKYNL